MTERLPVGVVTGFLGAGKTTLLRRVLRDPAWADSAVIVNEYGEVPLDHELVAAGDETFLSVATGCLCCVVRTDLSRTLLDLHRRRAAGEVPRYARVLIETSGLADPAPILHALMLDEPTSATHRLRSVVPLVDAQHGAASLEARLRALNPAAPIRRATRGDVEPGWLFAPSQHAAGPEALAAWLAEIG